MAKFMVAISYREGVVLCEKYTKLDGQYFKGLVEREFPNTFVPDCRLCRKYPI